MTIRSSVHATLPADVEPFLAFYARFPDLAVPVRPALAPFRAGRCVNLSQSPVLQHRRHREGYHR